jgi:hypothetical protein
MELDFSRLTLNDDFDKLINILLEQNQSILALQMSIGVNYLMDSIIDIRNSKIKNFYTIIENLDMIIRDSNNAIMYALDEETELFFDDIKIGAINSKNCINLFIDKKS